MQNPHDFVSFLRPILVFIDSLRILPYSPSSALVMCTLHNQITGVVSPFCTRSLLKKVVDTALERFGISFFVGVELEFVLARTCNPLEPVDYSVFANTITLDEQEGFLVALYKWLTMLDIPISQIHSESAPGQLEVVLAHQNDALQMADQVILAKEVSQIVTASHLSIERHTCFVSSVLHIFFVIDDMRMCQASWTMCNILAKGFFRPSRKWLAYSSFFSARSFLSECIRRSF